MPSSLQYTIVSALNSQIRVTDRPMTRQGLGIATGAKGTVMLLESKLHGDRNYYNIDLT